MARPLSVSALALAAILGATPLWADVTPEDVWANWQKGLTAQGQKLTVESEAREGETLIVKGLTLTTQDPSGGAGSFTLPELRFTDLGDGTVSVDLPETYPIQLTLPPATEGGKPQDVTVNVTTKDASTIASGMPDAISYQSEIGSVSATATVVAADGKSTADITAGLTQVSGTYKLGAAESGQTMTNSFTAKAFDLAAKVRSVDKQSDADISLTLTDFGGQGEMTGIPADGTDDFEQAMKDGLTLDAAMSYGSGALQVTGTDAGTPFRLTGGLGGGNFALSMGGQKFHYDLSNKSLSLDLSATDSTGEDFALTAALADFGSKLDMQGSMIWSDNNDFGAALRAGLSMTGGIGIGTTSFDFSGADQGSPVSVKASTGEVNVAFSMDKSQMHYATGSKAISIAVAAAGMLVPEAAMDLGEFAFDLAMPITKSDQSAPFTYVTRIVDLKLSDALWAMADPTGGLNHEAASLILDLSGMATLNADLMDDAFALESGAEEVPGQLDALDLKQFLLKGLGAELTGVGGFTFDNSDMTTLPGMPLPTGKIDLKATGLNALIDKAVDLGLMQPEEAMQGRMMLSMFANTSSTADEMTSVLEFKDGHFYANGQQMQ